MSDKRREIILQIETSHSLQQIAISHQRLNRSNIVSSYRGKQTVNSYLVSSHFNHIAAQDVAKRPPYSYISNSFAHQDWDSIPCGVKQACHIYMTMFAEGKSFLHGKSFKCSTPPPVEVSPLQASASCCSLLDTATVFL